jgi:hypothetical protein
MICFGDRSLLFLGGIMMVFNFFGLSSDVLSGWVVRAWAEAKEDVLIVRSRLMQQMG